MPRPGRAGPVATLTLNPSVDLCASVDRIEPTRKLRCYDVRRDPGGGGINIARVIRRLGGRAVAIFPAGGAPGERLKAMLRAERTPFHSLDIAGETREDFTAQDHLTGEQYRFVMPGPRLKPAEWAAALDAVATLDPAPAILAASGSLPPGAPAGLYGRLAMSARSTGIRLALDAAGPALRYGLAAGVWLVKPNLRELEELTGHPLPDMASRLEACRAIVSHGGAEIVALSMGAQGALLVSASEAWRAEAPALTPLSAIGAGDSFMAALTWALHAGAAPAEALRRAVAAGSAALLAPGTQLCRAADVRRLLERVCVSPL
ncbi:MAG: 1-phosphofructokinase family hexose kinase [Caulobacterales bacterium]